MPREPKLDLEASWDAISRALVREGSSSGPALARAAGISQPSFSRIAASHRDELLVSGRGRATRYSLRRMVAGVQVPVPVHEINEDATSRRVADLHPIATEGYHVEAAVEDVDSGSHADLPYFLNDLRPRGFLGRIVPMQHPELRLPTDVRLWSGDQCLRYLTRYAWNLPGNLIVGKEAFSLYLERTLHPPKRVAPRQRAAEYPILAADALAGATPGSSAGGEQPKFLTTVAAGGREVLVKFSPRSKNEIARRFADLLIAEHLALEVLRARRKAAAESELVFADVQVFLEVIRFDRTPEGGRRGLISAETLDAQFVGGASSWVSVVEALAAQGMLDESAAQQVRFLHWFGRLIGNTDMHLGNLSFFTRGHRVLGVAPAYDMLPMLYAPQQGNLPPRRLDMALPDPSEADAWVEATEAAEEFWRRVVCDERISKGFRCMAEENAAALKKVGVLAERLPRREAH